MDVLLHAAPARVHKGLSGSSILPPSCLDLTEVGHEPGSGPRDFTVHPVLVQLLSQRCIVGRGDIKQSIVAFCVGSVLPKQVFGRKNNELIGHIEEVCECTCCPVYCVSSWFTSLLSGRRTSCCLVFQSLWGFFHDKS